MRKATKLTDQSAGVRPRSAAGGFSLLEVLVIIAIAAVITGIILPSFRGFITDSRRNGAAEHIANDARRARARAITKGWQFRIYGYNSGSTSPFKNQYKMIGRSSAAVAWPSVTSAPMENTTQMVGRWIDIGKIYPGVVLNPADGTADFWVSFDSRGVRFEVDPSFTPMVVTNMTSPAKTVTVSAVGNVDIQ